MDTNIRLPSTGKDVPEVSPLPADAGVTSDIEHGRLHGLKNAVLVIETARRSERGTGGGLATVLTPGMGVLIFGVGLAQALVASNIKEKVSQAASTPYVVWSLAWSCVGTHPKVRAFGVRVEYPQSCGCARKHDEK